MEYRSRTTLLGLPLLHVAIAVGGIAIGGASLGALALGGAALGLVAIGGLAVGLVAVGGAAVAWYTAVGGLAVTHDLAVGGAAFAHHAVGSRLSDLGTGRPHPRAPLRIVDALALAVVVGAVAALLLHLRRERASQG